MTFIARQFLDNPVLFLGVVSVAATAALSEGLISGPVAVVAVAVVTFIQRQLVAPEYEV